jgi:hypothetical protein
MSSMVLARRTPFIVAVFEGLADLAQVDLSAAGNGGVKLLPFAVVVNKPDPGNDLLDVTAWLSGRLGQGADVIDVQLLREFDATTLRTIGYKRRPV